MSQVCSKREGRTFCEFVTKAERRLVLPWTGLAGLRLVGKTVYEVYDSVQNQVDTALEVEKNWGSDFSGIMDDGIICSETIGMKIKKFDFDFPAVAVHPVKNREVLEQLGVPDPLSGGRMLKNVKSIQALSQKSTKPVAISIEGPFTLAGQIAGVEDLARASIIDPEFVLDLLNYTTKVVRRYAQAVSDAGADIVSIAEPTSIILSEKQFRKLVVPFVQSVFHDLDAWKVMHICGDTNHLLEAMLSCGVEGLSLDQVMDIPEIITRIPEDLVLFGNIDPLEVMLEMDADGVAQKTAALLSAVDNFPNFIMSTGCDCVFDTPYENIQALVQTTQDHAMPTSFHRRATKRKFFHAKVVKSERKTVPRYGAKQQGLIQHIRQAVIRYQEERCCELCEQAVAQGYSPFTVVEEGLASGMEEVGYLFEESTYFIPELLMSAQTLYAGLDVVKPHMVMKDVSVKGKLMIGVIEGDVHEIGKNLVITMFTAAGWDVCNLGADVGTQAFVEAYKENKPDVVGISALMNTTMKAIPSTIKALRSVNPRARIMVGGAPVNPQKAQDFGADAYAHNAVQAVREGVKLLGKGAGG